MVSHTLVINQTKEEMRTYREDGVIYRVHYYHTLDSASTLMLELAQMVADIQRVQSSPLYQWGQRKIRNR